MNRLLFNSILLRILLNNGIEPTKAVAIAAVTETRIFDMPGGETWPEPTVEAQRSHEEAIRE